MTTRELLDRYGRRGTIVTVLGGPLLAVSMVLAAARVEPYAFIVAVVGSLLFGSGLISEFFGARCLAWGTPVVPVRSQARSSHRPVTSILPVLLVIPRQGLRRPRRLIRHWSELVMEVRSNICRSISEADETSTGPASFIAVDPDGNPILVDQHV